MNYDMKQVTQKASKSPKGDLENNVVIGNPNDVTAKFYDLKDEVSSDVTDAEIAFINTLVELPANILDVGCGTGRHLLPLYQNGFQAVGIDTSEGHLDILKDKNKNIETHNTSFFDYKSDQKWNLIILMWNTFNEMVLTNDDLDLFFNQAYALIRPRGIILINFMNWEKINLDSWSEGYEKDDFKLLWQVQSYDLELNTTTSNERIESSGKVYETQIKQRWWRESDIKNKAKQYGFSLSSKSLSVNDDHYYVLIKR